VGLLPAPLQEITSVTLVSMSTKKRDLAAQENLQTSEPTTTTDARGYYTFTNLPADDDEDRDDPRRFCLLIPASHKRFSNSTAII
jgi:hypothetical protein